MKLKSVTLSVAAAAVAALVTACGGGGGTQASVQLSGVAAVGLALANSSVDVKCAAGTGTATTDGSGAYSVSVTNGQLPCIVKVTGTANGLPVTLHSLAEGTGSTATANVTPLTEMILARAAGTTPAALFESFSASAVSSTALDAATADIVTVLRTALGVDLGDIDPFTTPLVAATGDNPGSGNTYDQLLDQLGTKVPPSMLADVVREIAMTSEGASAPLNLGDVLAGSLAGCPQALSGKYRIVDYWGEAATVDINFRNMTLHDGTQQFAMTASSSQACQFDVAGDVPTTVVIGPSGAGATRDSESFGFIFPVQSHRLADVAGDWEFLESGVNESKVGEHFVGKMSFAADGLATVCEYDVMANNFSTCQPDTEETIQIQERSDGAFTLNYGTSTSPVFGFRAPDGTLTLFGVNNEENSEGHFRTLFVLTKPQTAVSPSVGSVSKFWDITQSYAPPTTAAPDGRLSTTFVADAVTVTALSGSSQTRTRASDGRIDTFQLNQPIAGLRFRAQGTSNLGTPLSAVYQRFLPGTGMAIYIDGQSPAHFAGAVVTRP